VQEEVLTTAVIGYASTTESIVSTVLCATTGAAYVINILLEFAIIGEKLCLFHTTGRYDLTFPYFLLSPAELCETKVLIFSVEWSVGDDWKWRFV